MTDLPQLNDSEFRTIQQVVYEAAGIAIADTKRRLLSSRVRRRLQALSLNGFAAYLERLAADRTGMELTALLDVVSTHETSFFRTPAHFQWFETQFLPEQSRRIGAEGRDAELLVWSAACSSGEEAYTLAMILYRYRERLPGLTPRILATDISTSAVEHGRTGRYSHDSVSKLPPDYERYVRACAGGWQVIEPVAALVKFSTWNLMQKAPVCQVDCVFLRNVLIYFDRRSKPTVLASVIAALRPGGYLVVGPSEGIPDVPEGLVRRQSFLFQRV